MKGCLLDRDTSKLEQEYDYATDEDQVYEAKHMLVSEVAEAIQFTANENPIELVENLSWVV